MEGTYIYIYLSRVLYSFLFFSFFFIFFCIYRKKKEETFLSFFLSLYISLPYSIFPYFRHIFNNFNHLQQFHQHPFSIFLPQPQQLQQVSSIIFATSSTMSLHKFLHKFLHKLLNKSYSTITTFALFIRM